MFLLERERRDDGDIPQEIFELAGSTGNVYYVTIKQVPDCTCPDSCNGNICKHIIYVLRLILRAPPDIEFQSAFLVSELKQIFENSPEVEHTSDHDHADEIHRKPVDDHCPVCFTGFEAHEDIIWCKAACGNNIHKECFRQWARSNQGKQVCCVYWLALNRSLVWYFVANKVKSFCMEGR